MKKKIIILIISIFLIIGIIIAQPAQAGIIENTIEWFREILGIANNKIEIDNHKISSIIDFEKSDNLKNKIKENDDIKVEDTFTKLKYGGIKHNINIINLQNKIITNYNYSTIIEIEESEIMWNGTVYELTSTPIKLQPFYEKTNLIIPNIFFGNDNKRINYRHIGKLGGYALVSIGKVELRLDNISIEPLSNYYLDPTYYNQTDGFKTTDVGSDAPAGIVTNGSDLWFADSTDDFIYNTDIYGNNRTTGFKTAPAGNTAPQGLAMNTTEIWVGDFDEITIYHFGLDGSNRTGSIDVGVIGVSSLHDITTNGSDFWIVDGGVTDNFVFHIDAEGVNQSDGFKLTDIGSDAGARGIDTNNTNLWILDRGDSFIFHTTLIGTNQSDGIDYSSIGSTNAAGVARYNNNYWIVDPIDRFIYHINQTQVATSPPDVTLISPTSGTSDYTEEINFTYQVTENLFYNIDNCSIFIGGILNETDITITEAVDQTFNITIPYGAMTWKVGCYNNNSIQGNSSQNTYTRDIPYPVVGLQLPEDNQELSVKSVNFTYNTSIPYNVVSSCSLWLNGLLNQTDSTITEIINQSINLTINNSHTQTWLVECESNRGNKANSSTYTFEYNTNPTLPSVLSPVNNTIIVRDSINISCSGSIDLEDSVNYSFWNGTTPSTMAMSQNSSLITYNLTFPIVNHYYWKCKANDGIGNSSFTPIRRVTYAEVNPNCTIGNSTSIISYNFTFQDENNYTSLSDITLSSAWNVWGNDSTINKTVRINDLVFPNEVAYCISPKNDTSLNVKGIIEYTKTDYDTRFYYLDASSYVNSLTRDVILYLTLSTATTDVTVTVTDNADIPLGGILTKALLYDVGTDSYAEVQAETTNPSGQVRMQLILNRFYIFKFYRDGVLLDQTISFKLYSTSITFKITTAIEPLKPTVDLRKLPVVFTWVNTTKNISITYSGGENVGDITDLCWLVDNMTTQNISTLYDFCWLVPAFPSGEDDYIIPTTNGYFRAYAYAVINGIRYSLGYREMDLREKTSIW